MASSPAPPAAVMTDMRTCPYSFVVPHIIGGPHRSVGGCTLKLLHHFLCPVTFEDSAVHEGDGSLNLLQSRLNIKTVDRGQSMTGWHSVGHGRRGEVGLVDESLLVGGAEGLAVTGVVGRPLQHVLSMELG